MKLNLTNGIVMIGWDNQSDAVDYYFGDVLMLP